MPGEGTSEETTVCFSRDPWLVEYDKRAIDENLESFEPRPRLRILLRVAAKVIHVDVLPSQRRADLALPRWYKVDSTLSSPRVALHCDVQRIRRIRLQGSSLLNTPAITTVHQKSVPSRRVFHQHPS